MPLESSDDVQQLHFKDERGAGRDDVPHPPLPVGHVGRDHQHPALTHAHAVHPLVPALDHLEHGGTDTEIYDKKQVFCEEATYCGKRTLKQINNINNKKNNSVVSVFKFLIHLE